MSDFDLRVISLGAGVQSSTLYLMAVEGLLTPRPDLAIFADTQVEPQYVYEHLEWLDREFGHIIPIRRPTAGSLLNAVERSVDGTKGRFAAVPFWVRGEDGREAPGRRQCTREYKIDVVQKQIRTELGLKPRQRAAGRFEVEEWIGISLDEAHRANPSRHWLTTRWPLLYDVPMRRHECLEWMEKHGYPRPGKSACTFCPWRTLPEYRAMRDREPSAFQQAVEVDELLRSRGTTKGMKAPQFVHRSLRPLAEVIDEPEWDDEQLDLFGNECTGCCGT